LRNKLRLTHATAAATEPCRGNNRRYVTTAESTKMRSVRPSFEMPTDNITGPLNVVATCYLARLLIFLTVHLMFSGHLFLLISCMSLTNHIFGSRSFHAAAPTVWNSFPDSIRSSNTLNFFRRHLKHTISKLLLIPPSGKP